jgi:hypothetical protein
MNKKAQGLSLNTIIVAIIVLIVLVVIIMLFTGYFGSKFTPGVTSCGAQGGTCILTADCKSAFGAGRTISSSDCQTEGNVCCIQPVGAQSPFGEVGAPPSTPSATCPEDCNNCDIVSGRCLDSFGGAPGSPGDSDEESTDDATPEESTTDTDEESTDDATPEESDN